MTFHNCLSGYLAAGGKDAAHMEHIREGGAVHACDALAPTHLRPGEMPADVVRRLSGCLVGQYGCIQPCCDCVALRAAELQVQLCKRVRCKRLSSPQMLRRRLSENTTLGLDTVQVRFFEVTEDELVKQRRLFRDGQLSLKIEAETFDMAEYNAFVDSVAEETAALKQKQQEAAAAQVRLTALRRGDEGSGSR